MYDWKITMITRNLPYSFKIYLYGQRSRTVGVITCNTWMSLAKTFWDWSEHDNFMNRIRESKSAGFVITSLHLLLGHSSSLHRSIPAGRGSLFDHIDPLAALCGWSTSHITRKGTGIVILDIYETFSIWWFVDLSMGKEDERDFFDWFSLIMISGGNLFVLAQHIVHSCSHMST